METSSPQFGVPDPGRRSGTEPFRPTGRPPVAVLTVCDDGKESGEKVRIRAARFVIGRTDGDLVLGHDELISSSHLEITRRFLGGVYRWAITDLQSTNGFFVRISRGVLSHESEILVGGGRYRFLSAVEDSAVGNPEPGRPFPLRHPTLVELVGGRPRGEVPLVGLEYWIGRDPGCLIGRPDDPFAEPRHARLFRDDRGQWCFQNNDARNGVWLRRAKWDVKSHCRFQIGEQRFRLDVPG
jgi:pSer/pThr/pTyr-binding forkhead associated (FHA) protein